MSSIFTSPNYLRTILSSYNIPYGALFDGSTGYLTRTGVSPSDTTKYTVSFWQLICTLGSEQVFFSHSSDANLQVYHGSNDVLVFGERNGASYNDTAVKRDVAAFEHFVVAVDTTQATAEDRFKVYLNGKDVTSDWVASAAFVQNDPTYINSAETITFGRYTPSAIRYFHGVISEFHMVDGQALTPSVFGQSARNGNWVAKKYTGIYGANGFYLDFSNPSNLGADLSGNGNNWTIYGTVAQAASTPTHVDHAFNPLTLRNGGSAIVSKGNTFYDPGPSGADNSMFGTLLIPAGSKKYIEALYTIEVGTGNQCRIGISDTCDPAGAYAKAGTAQGMWACDFRGQDTGLKAYDEGSIAEYGASAADGSIVGVCIDLENGCIYAHDDGNYWNSGDPEAGTGPVISNIPTDRDMYVHYSIDVGSTHRSSLALISEADMTHQPAGYDAHTTTNLYDNTSINLNEHFNITLTSGTGAPVTVPSGLDEVDLCLAKSRDGTAKHWQIASTELLGNNKVIYTSSTYAEENPTTDTGGGGIGSLSGGDINIVSGTTDTSNLNESGKNFVFYNWKLPSSEMNMDGDITVSWKYNATLGMAVGTYTGSGISGDVLGLPYVNGNAPKALLIKRRDAAANWMFGCDDIGWTKYMYLDSTAAASTGSFFNDEAPTATTKSLPGSGYSAVNASGGAYIIIAFWETEFCKVFSYVGNNDADGTFMNLGIRPAWCLFKNSGLSGTDWVIYDEARDPANPATTELKVNSSAAEGSDTADSLDLVSNGIKQRNTSNQLNTPYTYIGVAIGHPQGEIENPAR